MDPSIHMNKQEKLKKQRQLTSVRLWRLALSISFHDKHKYIVIIANKKVAIVNWLAYWHPAQNKTNKTTSTNNTKKPNKKPEFSILKSLQHCFSFSILPLKS